jgi:hypothetical protein
MLTLPPPCPQRRIKWSQAVIFLARIKPKIYSGDMNEIDILAE